MKHHSELGLYTGHIFCSLSLVSYQQNIYEVNFHGSWDLKIEFYFEELWWLLWLFSNVNDRFRRIEWFGLACLFPLLHTIMNLGWVLKEIVIFNWPQNLNGTHKRNSALFWKHTTNYGEMWLSHHRPNQFNTSQQLLLRKTVIYW